MEEHKSKKMLGTMVIFFVVIMIFWQIAGRIVPITREFFKSQEWLVNPVSSYPLIGLLIFSLILSLYTNLFYKFGISKETLDSMTAAKKESKEMQKKIKEYKNEPEKAMALQKEMMSKSLQTASLSFGTMFSIKFVFLVTLPSLIFLFLIVGPIYMAANVGYIINWGFSIFGRTGAGWLLTLIFLSFIMTPLTKKLLKLDF